MTKRHSRRSFAQLLAFSGASFALFACQSSPYQVAVPRSEPLDAVVLSLQTTARKSLVGFISPRGRYAEKLRPQIAARLIEEGFVLKQQTAQLHLVVQVYEITTGGTAGTARCDLILEIYDKWPGDLSETKMPKELVPVFAMKITNEAKARTKGYPREELAELAAEQCVEDLVAYLVRSKNHPMN